MIHSLAVLLLILLGRTTRGTTPLVRLLDLALEGVVPAVLSHVVRAARQQLRDLGPLVAKFSLLADDRFLLPASHGQDDECSRTADDGGEKVRTSSADHGPLLRLGSSWFL